MAELATIARPYAEALFRSGNHDNGNAGNVYHDNNHHRTA